LRISLPLIECLIDNERYYLPDTLAPPACEQLRPMLRQRIGQVSSPARPRPDRKHGARDLAELDHLLGPP
jgi:hypothetical protein